MNGKALTWALTGTLLACGIAAATAQQRQAAASKPDPRVGLKAGIRDAGQAIRNMELVASLPKPDGFFDPAKPLGNPTAPEPPDGQTPQRPPFDPATANRLDFSNSDLAFDGHHLFMGSFHGYNIYDIEESHDPKLLASIVCPGGQGDVSVYKNLLFMSVEQGRGRLDCGTQGHQTEVSSERFRGVRIFDITDITKPRQVAAVQTCRGSHTHTLVPDPRDPNSIYVYGSGTSPVRPGQELEGCSGSEPKDDPNTSLFSIDVIQVPLAAPSTAHIVNRLLDELLQSTSTAAGSSGFTLDFTSALPDYTGDRETTAHFFRQLLAYAGAYLATVGRPHLLAIKTGDLVDTPTLFPVAPSTHIQLDITETERVNPSGRILPSLTDSLDVLSLYRLAGALGATLDVSAPASGPFRMIVRLPTGPSPASGQPQVTDAAAIERTPEAPPSVDPSAAQDLVTAARTERRSNARVQTALPAKITRGSSVWKGTVMSLSVSGAGIRVQGDFPPLPSQEAVIRVTTAVATLELNGQAHTRPAAASGIQLSIQPDTRLIVQFTGPNQTERAVLASLIAATHERSLAFTLDIHLPIPAILPHADRPPSFDLAEYDRRETVRVSTALPVRLQTTFRQEHGTRLQAQVINLSRSGACIVGRERPEALEERLEIHFAPAHRSEPGSHEPGAPDTTLAARVVWTAADPTVPSALHTTDRDNAVRSGLRFEPLTPYAERELNRVIKQHLRAQRSGEAFSTAAPVISLPRECRNARGQTIAITDDHLSQLVDPNCPTIIMAPGYGQTASDYMALSYYLAQHRFRVLRYDPTNHLGNSEGELQQTTLRSMQHDLEKVMEFVRHTWPQAPLVVIACDLAARAALKTAAHTDPLDLLLLVNPAIDMASLLMAVHGHDLIADYQFGLRRGVCNLLGLNVNVDQFVSDLVAGRCADLESTLEDLRLIRSPLCIATSPADSTALPPTDLPHAFMTALGTHTRLANISSPVTDRHLDVHGAPPAAFGQLLKQISSIISVQTLSPQQEIAAQPFVARQHRIEQEFNFLRHDGSQINREALCAAHLAQLPQLGNLHEYRKLLDDLYGLMSPLEPGAVLVDAGVGQSDLTRTALVNHTYRAGQSSWTDRPPPLMVGVGRSRERISQARHAALVLQRELATGFVGRLSAMPPLAIAWLQADRRSALPFKTGSVSRLVCNLSLPYAPSPLAALKEWDRVLHPDGRLILTVFHPNTDLSPIYRRHLRQANQDEFSAQAQPLLHYFARLREAIHHGILQTFDEAGLGALLRQCGIVSFRILPIFDGQALVAIVGKQNSSGSLR